MASNRSGHVYMEQAGGDGGAAGAGGQGGQGGQGGSQGGGAQAPFSDAVSARTFLKDFVNDEGVLKAVPDDKVVGWAGHLKTKVDGFGNQFPEKWRNLIAGDNAEHLKTLERFATPKALYDSYGALRQKMSSGELRQITPFPDKGTPEDQAAWRTTNGIPAKSEEYLANFKAPEGVVLDDDDKAVLGKLSASAHASHLPPAAFNATASWFLAEKKERVEARQDKDSQSFASSEDAMRAEWGPGYRENVARISAFLDIAPKGIKDAVGNARKADGSPLMHDPDFLRFMVDTARTINPAGVVLPGAGGNLAQSVADEINTIETTMRENRSKYDKDEKMQARLRELYGARDKLQGKKAA